jgi:hypothetical protein
MVHGDTTHQKLSFISSFPSAFSHFLILVRICSRRIGSYSVTFFSFAVPIRPLRCSPSSPPQAPAEGHLGPSLYYYLPHTYLVHTGASSRSCVFNIAQSYMSQITHNEAHISSRFAVWGLPECQTSYLISPAFGICKRSSEVYECCCCDLRWRA